MIDIAHDGQELAPHPYLHHSHRPPDQLVRLAPALYLRNGSRNSVRIGRFIASLAGPRSGVYNSADIELLKETATCCAMATNSAIQTKMPSVSAAAGLKNKNRSNRPARPRKKHSPAHHPNTNKLTTTEQKQSQEKVDKTDKTAEKRRAATTTATQSGAYVIVKFNKLPCFLACATSVLSLCSCALVGQR